MLKELFTICDHKWQQSRKLREIVERFNLAQKDGVYELSIKRVSDTRTVAQNRYLWPLLGILADAIGYESPESVLSDAMENLGMGKYVKFRGREKFERDSSRLKDKEIFGQIIDELFKIAAFLNEDRPIESHIILPKRELGLK